VWKKFKSENAKKRKIIMQEQYNYFVTNNIWMLVSLPKGRKLVFCKWVFKIKHDVNGKVEHCKARPMTIGFTQTYGIHYNKTSA